MKIVLSIWMESANRKANNKADKPMLVSVIKIGSKNKQKIKIRNDGLFVRDNSWFIQLHAHICPHLSPQLCQTQKPWGRWRAGGGYSLGTQHGPEQQAKDGERGLPTSTTPPPQTLSSRGQEPTHQGSSEQTSKSTHDLEGYKIPSTYTHTFK